MRIYILSLLFIINNLKLLDTIKFTILIQFIYLIIHCILRNTPTIIATVIHLKKLL